jgi:hypothetical protein
MQPTVQLLTLRRTTKYNTRLSLPPDYIRTYGLQDGDRVLWIPDDTGVRLQFTRSPSSCEVLTHPAIHRNGGEP